MQQENVFIKSVFGEQLCLFLFSARSCKITTFFCFALFWFLFFLFFFVFYLLGIRLARNSEEGAPSLRDHREVISLANLVLWLQPKSQEGGQTNDNKETQLQSEDLLPLVGSRIHARKFLTNLLRKGDEQEAGDVTEQRMMREFMDTINENELRKEAEKNVHALLLRQQSNARVEASIQTV